MPENKEKQTMIIINNDK